MQKIIGFPNIDFQMLLGPTGPRKKSASSPPQNSQSFFEIIEGPNQILPELLNNVWRLYRLGQPSDSSLRGRKSWFFRRLFKIPIRKYYNEWRGSRWTSQYTREAHYSIADGEEIACQWKYFW